MAKKTKPAGKKHPLNMRTTKEMRRMLETAAHISGRSLVNEVESRLERSFYTDLLLDLAHGRQAKLVSALSTAVAVASATLKNKKERISEMQNAAAHIIAILEEQDLEDVLQNEAPGHTQRGIGLAEMVIASAHPELMDRFHQRVEKLKEAER
jgi:uncharacterized protein (DUF1778 family)